MILVDLVGFLEAIDGALAAGATNPALFAGEAVVGVLPKLPVPNNPKSLFPPPATMLGGIPVYSDPTLVPTAIMLLAGNDVDVRRAAIAVANAVIERSEQKIS